MKNIRKYMTALLAACLLLTTEAGAAPAEAAEDGQERVNVYFEADGERSFNSEEPASVTMTAQVPKDGTYLLDLYAEGGWTEFSQAPAAVTSPDEALAVVNEREEYGDVYGGATICLVELTAGEYTLQAEDACYLSADLTLVYPLESVLGPIEEGAYFGTVDEAMTVNYTLTGSNARVEIYNGTAEEMHTAGSLMAWDEEFAGNPDTDQNSVAFEPGTVVIDYQDVDGNGSLEGAEADMSTNEAAVLRGEPIEFVNVSDEDDYGITAFPGDEPATGTAAIAGDGYYFLDMDLHYYTDRETFTFSSDIPALPDLAAVPDWATGYDDFVGTDETRVYMVSDMASGEYSITVGNVMCNASFFPVQTVDSLTGQFEGRNMYVCFLDEPASATFTMDEYSTEVSFYGGAEADGFLQDLTPEIEVGADGMAEVTVEFPAGAALIDTHSYHVDSITGVQN